MRFKALILPLSLVLNACFLFTIVYLLLQGTPEVRSGRFGVLTSTVEIGRSGGNVKIFTLPKGLIVRDVSASGADWFEPHRFRIVITSDRENLVDYSIDQVKAESGYGEYYSADVKR